MMDAIIKTGLWNFCERAYARSLLLSFTRISLGKLVEVRTSCTTRMRSNCFGIDEKDITLAN